MSGRPSHFGKVVSRKPKKKLGSTWYCITKACTQPVCSGACGMARSGQRAPTSHAAHHAMAISRFIEPMKNIRRCGAVASRPGESAAGLGSG